MGILKCFYDKIIYEQFVRLDSDYRKFLLHDWEKDTDISESDFYSAIEKAAISQFRFVYKVDLKNSIWKVIQSLRRIILNEDEINAQFTELLKINATLPAQRSPEWYIFRENMITASDWGKVMGYIGNDVELLRNKLGITQFKGNAATQFGTKYEAVATSVYEKRMGKKIVDFGCLRHPNPNLFFLGASPDGISDDGVMLEIKCPTSREILPIPTTYYWAQMQGQMEICDLERCDFLECKIEEYADEEAYIEDISQDGSRESGVVVSFKKKDGALVHEYSPFFLQGEPLQEWTIKHIREKTLLPKFADRLEYLGASYWYIKFYQCVPVFRDREWFAEAKVKLAEFYEKWQHYKRLGEDGIRQLQILKPKKSEYGDKSITEYTGVVIEEKEEVLSVPKLNRFGFSSTKISEKNIIEAPEAPEHDDEKILPKFKKFGFSKL
jgi:putative phage-type endonuclease